MMNRSQKMLLQMMGASSALMLLSLWLSYRILADEPGLARQVAACPANSGQVVVAMRSGHDH